MAKDNENGKAAATPAGGKAAATPALMRGIEIGGAGHGPAAGVRNKTPRGELCDMLNLREPNDSQLYQAAVAEIVALREKLAK